ncbi:uncharacterized protein LOC143034398 [Oratosquilla oratoria]|uniref:uncharacterized protein LOC143034398 n=1 Tax=Oratosquilla oratoria TaxID=337810 RepID=UPI003F76F9B5
MAGTGSTVRMVSPRPPLPDTNHCTVAHRLLVHGLMPAAPTGPPSALPAGPLPARQPTYHRRQPLDTYMRPVSKFHGRNWLMKLVPQWKEVFLVQQGKPGNVAHDITTVLNSHSELFKEELSCYNGPEVEVPLSDVSKFHKARPIPYAFQSNVKEELLNMENKGVMESFMCSLWYCFHCASKKDSDQVRVYGDFNVTDDKCADLPPEASCQFHHRHLPGCKDGFSSLLHSTAHSNADSMPRLPLGNTLNCDRELVDFYFLESDILTTVTHQQIQKKTAVLIKVLHNTINGWPNASENDQDLKTFSHCKDKLSVEQGCLLWGFHVVIPTVLQGDILQEVHETHLSMTKMKALVRSYVWWLSMDKQIEGVIFSCKVCQSLRTDPPTTPVHPWTFPSKPRSRLHADFADPVSEKIYLVLVDEYSKYLEVFQMKSTTAIAI